MDLEDPYVGLPNRNILPLGEGQPVEQVGGIEDAVLQHIVDLEIRFDLRLIEIVFRLANLLGVEIPVPWLELESSRCASMTAWISCAFGARLWPWPAESAH